MPLVYPRLREIAGKFLGVRDDATVSPSVLVHETYLRLLSQEKLQWSDREHFYNFSAMMMRRVLMDTLRAKKSMKRGGGAIPVPLHDEMKWVLLNREEIIGLNFALEELGALDARKARMVDLRYFLGCTTDEVVELTGTSKATIDRDLKLARAWLFREMEKTRNELT